MNISKADIIERLSNLPHDKLVDLLKIYEAEQSKLRLAEANKDGLVFDIGRRVQPCRPSADSCLF